jgi:hypothetical protein
MDEETRNERSQAEDESEDLELAEADAEEVAGGLKRGLDQDAANAGWKV